MLVAFSAALIGTVAHAGPRTPPADEPPPEFGAIRKTRFGCPQFAGVYEWPPMNAEEPRPGQAGRRFFHNNIAGLSLHEPSYLWFQQPDDRKHLLVQTLAVPRPRERIAMHLQYWQSKLLANSQHHCSGGWLIIDEHDLPIAGLAASYGGPTRVEFRIVPLADGNLAIGQRINTRVGGSGLYWADAKIVDLPAGRRHLWSWARLKRVADDGKDIRVEYR